MHNIANSVCYVVSAASIVGIAFIGFCYVTYAVSAM